MSGPTAALAALIAACDWLDAAAVAAAELLADGEMLREGGPEASWFPPGFQLPRPGVFGRDARFAGGVWSPNVAVGRYAVIEPECVIGATAHGMDWLSTGFLSLDLAAEERDADSSASHRTPERTLIGCDVWIGPRSFIRGGVAIGHGAIVRAGSVVTRDVPPYAIVEGSPARPCGARFPPATVDRLLAARWWALPAAAVARLPLHDPAACLDLLP